MLENSDDSRQRGRDYKKIYKGETSKFADDAKFNAVCTKNYRKFKLQNIQNKVNNWSEKWQMSFNYAEHKYAGEENVWYQ